MVKKKSQTLEPNLDFIHLAGYIPAPTNSFLMSLCKLTSK